MAKLTPTFWPSLKSVQPVHAESTSSRQTIFYRFLHSNNKKVLITFSPGGSIPARTAGSSCPSDLKNQGDHPDHPTTTAVIRSGIYVGPHLSFGDLTPMTVGSAKVSRHAVEYSTSISLAQDWPCGAKKKRKKGRYRWGRD